MPPKKKAAHLCIAPSCDRPWRTKRMCDAHYIRHLRKLKGLALEGPVRRRDTRTDATGLFARIQVRPETREYFEKAAATEGQRVGTYVGVLLDELAGRNLVRPLVSGKTRRTG